MVNDHSDYKAPTFYFNGHIETILPALFRKVKGIKYEHERIDTPDKDFLDLFWSKVNSDKLVVISHGLEGNAHRPYVKGMVKAFNEHDYDVLAWNYRGCGNEMNYQIRFYHSGATDDLDHIIKYVRSKVSYLSIHLIGFSLGGNLTLKFLGEKENAIYPEVHNGVTFSVPLNLSTSSNKMDEFQNWIYSKRFLYYLKGKIRQKAQMMPDKISLKPLKQINSIRDFDDFYTGPLHGFKDAEDYYESNSSIYFLERIKIPVLIVNALNDPFLSKDCYPEADSIRNENITMEFPKKGGHCGFTSYEDSLYWSERRALEFIKREK